jgi:hypothetical protein
VKTIIEQIGPVTAAKYLENAPTNRRVDPRVVLGFARTMSAGRWRQTHQGIAFNSVGGLVDGQHRLSAIIKSGKTITMQVTRGLTDDDILVIDSGKARSSGDRLIIAGATTHHGTMTAAIVSSMTLAESGSCPKLSPDELKLIFEQNKECVEFAIDAFGSKMNSGWNAIVRGAFAYCYAFAPDEVNELARLIFTKENLHAGSAAHVFVMAMANGKLATTGSSGRSDTMARVLGIIRAHIEGRAMKQAKTSASIFTWAQQRRQFVNARTIAETLS